MAQGAWIRSSSAPASTVHEVQGSANVHGINTTWELQGVAIGDIFVGTLGGLYEITAFFAIGALGGPEGALVPSTQEWIQIKDLTGAATYNEATNTGGSYAIMRNWSNTTNATLAAKLAALLSSWQNREDEMIAWLTGTATGGPSSNGAYPLTDALGATVIVKCPARFASDINPLYHNAVTLGGADGVTVTHNHGNTNYAVAISLLDSASRAGEVSIGAIAANTVVIYNSGEPNIPALVTITVVA